MFALDGRNAVVTGAARGIGRAIAVALAEAGANVASLDLSDRAAAAETEAAIRAHGRQAWIGEGSTADPEAVEAVANRVEREWGAIDIWVNNAGQLLVKPMLETTLDEWRALMDTNLDGYAHGCRAAARRMVPRGAGRIVNVTSVTIRQPVSDLTAYVTAKGGVLGLTRSLALELAPHDVTVNAVAPGAIETPMTEDSYTPEVRSAYEARIALGRVGRPEDIAGAVVFLASDEAGYVTGQELLVDGGLALNGDI